MNDEINVELEVTKASEVTPTEVKWLWYPYIPFGKLTLLQGDPGDGKSKFMLSLAALLSKGELLPFTYKVKELFTIKEAREKQEREDRITARKKIETEKKPPVYLPIKSPD